MLKLSTAACSAFQSSVTPSPIAPKHGGVRCEARHLVRHSQTAASYKTGRMPDSAKALTMIQCRNCTIALPCDPTVCPKVARLVTCGGWVGGGHVDQAVHTYACAKRRHEIVRQEAFSSMTLAPQHTSPSHQRTLAESMFICSDSSGKSHLQANTANEKTAAVICLSRYG